MCSGGSTQVWPLTSERPRGRQVSLHPLPSPGLSGAICLFAQELRHTGKLRRKSTLFLEVFAFFCLAWDCRQISDRGTDALFWHSGSEAAASGDCAVPRWEFPAISLAGRPQEPGSLAAGAGHARGPSGWDQGGKGLHTPPTPCHGAWSPFHSLSAKRSSEEPAIASRDSLLPSRGGALCLRRPCNRWSSDLPLSALFFPLRPQKISLPSFPIHRMVLRVFEGNHSCLIPLGFRLPTP